MLSVHRVERHPQLLSTNRHLMQGYVDMAGVPRWDAAKRELAGTSKVVGGETYKVVLALNGYRPAGASAHVAGGAAVRARVEAVPGGDGLAVLSLDSQGNAQVRWALSFARR